jgi:L-lactate dehydrogenase
MIPNLQAYMVGEHGDSSVAVWSSVSVAGMPVLKSLRESHSSFDEEALEGIRRAVVDSAYEVISLKGYTSWAIGYSVASLVASLLRDQRRIHPVSVLATGFHAISDDHDVFLSLPARLGRAGVLGVAEMELTEEEGRRLRRSAKTLWENCQLLDLS